jgi:ribosome-associated heat shock protein Hsp15
MASVSDGADDDADAEGGRQRLDKWLWFIRVVKTRTQAAGLVTDGKVRVNSQRTDKPSLSLKASDVVTVTVGGHIRVLRMLRAGTRRGPAAEASELYEEVQHIRPSGPPGGRLGPSADRTAGGPQREPGAGRPTKKERRQTDRLRGPDR